MKTVIELIQKLIQTIASNRTILYTIAIAGLLTALPSFGLLVDDKGIVEPIYVQIQDSLRSSVNLTPELAELTAIEVENGLSIVQWYAGPKLIVVLSFAPNISEDQAEKTVALLQSNEAVANVVAQSAANLAFKPGDLARSYQPTDVIPDETLRGFDIDRLTRQRVIWSANDELPVCHSDRIIVRWKDEYVWNNGIGGGDKLFESFNIAAGCSILSESSYTDHDLTQVLQFDPYLYPVLSQLLLYQENEMVEYVQPDFFYELHTNPNDTIYATYQWGLPKISAPAAWTLPGGTRGSSSVNIAVADSGATISHPDLSGNIWSGQSSNNFNFYDGNSDVSDGYGHGTHVASIIGAQGNNSLCMSGVAWDVSLMIMKITDFQGQLHGLQAADTSTMVSAINAAKAHGAAAINLSIGLVQCTPGHWHWVQEDNQWECDLPYIDPDVQTALVQAESGTGMVAVCSAGNDGSNFNPLAPISPADIPTDNVISVAASDQSDARASFSNYSLTEVDLAAPGVGIYGLDTSFDGNDTHLSNYRVLDGTSQAAPHVTGTIALIKAKYGWENYVGLRDRILMGVDVLGSWSGLNRTSGRLDANKALHARTLIRNLSTRARVESGNSVMVSGFIIGGNGTDTLRVAFRGLGPSLSSDVSVATLSNPKIILYNSAGTQIASNDDWGTMAPSSKADFIAAGLDMHDGTSISSLESGIVATLSQGLYTVVLQSSTGSGFGVGLLELYELENGTKEKARLENVSTRCLVKTGDEQAISGIIVGDPTQGGNSAIPKRSILMLGLGPSLPSTISPKLANPFLQLYNSSGGLMSQDDSWGNLTSKPLDELTQQGLSPTNSLESALWPILSSGTYTTILSGVGGGTGIGQITMYEY